MVYSHLSVSESRIRLSPSGSYRLLTPFHHHWFSCSDGVFKRAVRFYYCRPFVRRGVVMKTKLQRAMWIVSCTSRCVTDFHFISSLTPFRLVFFRISPIILSESQLTFSISFSSFPLLRMLFSIDFVPLCYSITCLNKSHQLNTNLLSIIYFLIRHFIPNCPLKSILVPDYSNGETYSSRGGSVYRLLRKDTSAQWYISAENI